MQQISRQKLTENNKFIDDSELSQREKRIREAIFLYYMEDMTQEQVADEIGVTRPTVSEYLNSEEAKYFEPVFSSKEKGELKRWLQDGIYNTFRESQETLREIKQSGEAKPSTVTRASVQMVKNKERLINLLQELQELEKPQAEQSENENKSGEHVQFEMRYTSPDEEETSDEQD